MSSRNKPQSAASLNGHAPCITPFILRGNEPQPHHPPVDDRLSDQQGHTDSWLLISVLDGALSMTTSKKSRQKKTIRAGHIVLMPPAVYRHWQDKTAHYRFLEFDLSPPEQGGLSAYSCDDGLRWRRNQSIAPPIPKQKIPSPWSEYLTPQPPPQLHEQAITTLRWCCDRWWRGFSMRLQAQARLSRLLADWLSSTIEQHVADHDPMRDVEHEARRRIPTGFNVADMAVHCGMSRARFTLAYQKDRGQSPGAFLRKLRLEIAQELLTDPSWSIKRIAHHVGYQSAVTFARAFHAEYNCSPQQWRNRNQA